MSLFKCKEWWRTECGANEVFNKNSFLVAPLLGSEVKDVIIVGSYSGYLRIYSPSSRWSKDTKSTTGYKSSDLIIEVKLTGSIIDLKTGKFVSGSQEIHLAVLTPELLSIYTAVLVRGTAEYGDRCTLEEAYVHKLSVFPNAITVGSFGNVEGRDFICVQSLEGKLLFFEQETYAYSRILGGQLLPERLFYDAKNDYFVVVNSEWVLQYYRYQQVAENGRNIDKEGNEVPTILEPHWSYNLGEATLDINLVTLNSFEVTVILLGERNLYCFDNTCLALKCMKRLEYNAVCLKSYVIEPDGKMVILVIADTNTVMIYDDMRLKWCAQLPFAPLNVATAQFQYLNGLLVIISDKGQLEVCYLGTEPSVFPRPHIQRRGFNYETAKSETNRLLECGKGKLIADKRLTDSFVNSELLITLNLVPNYEQSTHYSVETNGKKEVTCKMLIELTSCTTLHDIQICFDVFKPITLSRINYTIPHLCEKYTLEESILISGNLLPLSSTFYITASYLSDGIKICVVQQIVELPLTLLLQTCSPETAASFVVTLRSVDNFIHFSQLFPEFGNKCSQKQTMNALGLQYINTNDIVTITNMIGNRYRLQTYNGLAIALIIHALNKRFSNKCNEHLRVTINQNHLQVALNQIEAHFTGRMKKNVVMNEIFLTMIQLKTVEKRILRGIRERNVHSLSNTGLITLLSSTCHRINLLLGDFAVAKEEQHYTSHNLHGSLTFLLLLIQLNICEDKYAILESAMGYVPQMRNDFDWEEVTDIILSHLSEMTLTGAETETTPFLYNRTDTIKDISKLKKRFSYVIDKFTNENR